MPVLEGLADLRDSLDHPRFREIVAGLIESIEGGMQLSQAMAKHPDIFDQTFVSLIAAGEQSGKLAEVFRSLTETLKWQDELAAQTKKLLMYPAFVGTIVLGVTFFLMIYLVPQMAGFIKNMGQELPFHTKALIFVSGIFVNYWYVILAIPVLAWAGLTFLIRTNPRARYKADELQATSVADRTDPAQNHPGPLRHLFRPDVRLGHHHSRLHPAVRTDRRQQGHRRWPCSAPGKLISEGQNVTASFQNVGMFPPLVMRMLKVGESHRRAG